MSVLKNKVSSAAYAYLVKNYKKRETKRWRNLWKKLVEPNVDKPIKFTVHGKEILINCGYTYPLYAREFKSLNNPLLQLAYQTKHTLGRSINFIDVGAAVGDTVLLIESNIVEVFNNILCIDGDKEFFKYLEKNLGSKENVRCVNCLLSDVADKQENELLRTHSGTASAQGNTTTIANTLDDVLNDLEVKYTIDLLKIDVDGFDGKVLKGAQKVLRQDKPSVIMEWHPILIKQTNNDYIQPFETLKDCGYTQFVFFNKFGVFSHFMFDVRKAEIDSLATLCINNKLGHDFHYDVVALQSDSLIDKIELAEGMFAKKKKSAY